MQARAAIPTATRSSAARSPSDDAIAAVSAPLRDSRGEISLTLRSAEAIGFGTMEGTRRHPERFSRSWRGAVAK